jgi:hypothetical protein
MGLIMLGRLKYSRIATEELTIYKSPSNDKIPAQLIKAEVEQFILRSINLLILFAIRRNCPTSGVNHCTYIKEG